MHRQKCNEDTTNIRAKTYAELRRKHWQYSNEELLETARLREDVDNIVRHDLKAPLNSIIGLPQIMMQEGEITEKQSEYRKNIEESGYRMLRMILNLWSEIF
ncbi:MAG: hypothetical protein NTX36_13490 [Proteobacteria bacterium]|nr:hypothetical protein [Pseudomonadota bacterium]